MSCTFLDGIVIDINHRHKKILSFHSEHFFSLFHFQYFYLCRKDARLPEQLQRAMAAEAEAAREARAKVKKVPNNTISLRQR